MPPRDFAFWAKSLGGQSRMRRSVSSPDETLRRVLKYDAKGSIYDELRDVSSGDETLCRLLDITFNDFKRRN